MSFPSLNDRREALNELESFVPNAKSSIVKDILKREIAAISRQVNQPIPIAVPEQPRSEPDVKKPVAAIPPREVQVPAEASIESNEVKFRAISSFAWDQEGYSGKNVFIYVSLPGIGQLPKPDEHIACDFTEDGFDLKIMQFNGENWRLVKKPLNNSIIPRDSKFKVKKDRIVITLKKKEGKYGSDHWTDLVQKGAAKKEVEKDPSKGIMDMMKQMYDDGDDNMKKMIGEAMMKSRQENVMRN